MKSKVDCIIPKEYEGTKVRLFKGDLARLEAIRDKINERIKMRDRKVVYGKNKATLTDAVHFGVICCESLSGDQIDTILAGLQSAHVAEACPC